MPIFYLFIFNRNPYEKFSGIPSYTARYLVNTVPSTQELYTLYIYYLWKYVGTREKSGELRVQTQMTAIHL